jgi:hypothetical protein
MLALKTISSTTAQAALSASVWGSAGVCRLWTRVGTASSSTARRVYVAIIRGGPESKRCVPLRTRPMKVDVN